MSIPSGDTVFSLDSSKITSLNLEPEEAFVLTRVDGHSTLTQIAQIVGFDLARTWKLLSRAHEAGIIQQIKSTGKTPASKMIKKEGAKTILDILDEEDRDENLSKIQRAKRNEILLRFEKREKQNHYEVLGVGPRPTKEEINAKYMKLVKDFHPDRFFGKELGHYKEKLEAIFSRITEAFQVLNDPPKRIEYDRTLAKLNLGDKTQEAQKKEPTKLTGKNIVEKFAKAKRYFEMGKEEETKGNWLSAANFFQMAVQLDPSTQDYGQALERMAPFILRKRADDTFEEAKQSLDIGETEEAIQRMEEALKLNSKKRECYRELAILYLNQGKDFPKARKYGENAVKLFPQSADVKVTLGSIYLMLNLLEDAKQQFKAALKIDENHAGAHEGLERAKQK